MSDAMEIGQRVVDLCRRLQWMEALDSLYSPDIVSIEAMGQPSMPARVDGIDAVRRKTEWWEKNHEIHSSQVDGPWPHGDRFIVHFKMDITPKAGPMAGRRMTIDEAGLYTVKQGKIVQEEFFYNMEG